MNIFHKYPFALILSSLIIGIYAYSFISANYFAAIGISFLVTVVTSVILFRKNYISQAPIRFRMLLLYVAIVFLGWLLSYFSDVRNKSDYYGKIVNQADYFTASIEEPPSIKEKITILNVTIYAAKIKNQWTKANGKAIINVYNNEEMPILKQGQLLIFPNKLLPIIHSQNPFSFDFANFQHKKGKYYQQFLGHSDIYLSNKGNQQPDDFFQNSRKKVNQIIDKNIKEPTTNSLLKAITINERQSLDKNLWQSYSKTGIVHIIAISGMHIGLFFYLIYYLLFFIRHRKHDWIKYLIAIPLIWTYITITGFPPSAVRAGVMISILSLGFIINRRGNGINTLLATAFILLSIFPNWLYDLGFQLSFVSVLSILIFYKPVFNWYKPNNKILRFFWNILAVSISVQPLIFPLILYYFHQFPVLGIIANIPASIYATVFMTGGLFMIFLGAIGIGTSWLGLLLTKITKGFNAIIDLIYRLSPDIFYSLYIDKVAFWLLMIVVLLFAFFIFYRKKNVLYISAVFVVFFGVYQSYWAVQKSHQEKLIVYNIYGKSIMENIIGNKSLLMHDAESLNKEYELFLKPAHIGYNINVVDTTNYQNCSFLVNNKKILYLTQGVDATKNDTPINVDYLIINRAAAKSIKELIALINADNIVFDSSVRPYEIETIKQNMIDSKIKPHFVTTQGAYIIE